MILVNLPSTQFQKKLSNVFCSLLILSYCFFVMPTFAWKPSDGDRSKKKSSQSSYSYSDSQKAKEKIISSQAGLNIPQWHIAIDAQFDPQLTDLIPGYHTVILMITSKRQEDLIMDKNQDKWIIIDKNGDHHTAINGVQNLSSSLVNNMNPKLIEKLLYPEIIKPRTSRHIDVFIPKSIDLTNFKEVVWKSSQFKKDFAIVMESNDNNATQLNDVFVNVDSKTNQNFKTLEQIYGKPEEVLNGKTNESPEIQYGTQTAEPRFKPLPYEEPIVIR